MKKAAGEGSVSGGESGFPCSILEEKGGIRVIAELPGISEEKIRIDLDGKILIITANGGRQHRMEISLPYKASLGRKRFHNGVLDLLLEKPTR
jgi:HSP20 family molecular chaperone IbpA